MKSITKIATTLILFTMLWTGTFLHDFFGLGLTPYAFTANAQTTQASHHKQIEKVSQVLKHCHSPWADFRAVLLTELPELVSEIKLPQMSSPESPRKPVSLVKGRDAPLYLVKCSLLI